MVITEKVENKFNSYQEPTHQIHKFDQVTIKLVTSDKEFVLFNDILDAAWTIIYALEKAQQGLRKLPREIKVGKMTYALNDFTAKDNLSVYKDIDFNHYWVWSTVDGPQTFLYTANGSIFMEIGEIFANHSKYESFRKNYKPILVKKIPQEQQDLWLKTCKKIRDDLDAQFLRAYLKKNEK
jgi:hypothetical protein